MAKSKIGLVRDIIENTAAYEDNLVPDEHEHIVDDLPADLREQLKTHPKLSENYAGTLLSISKNQATVTLKPTHDMTVDDFGLIHNGFIFGAAEYAAIAAINEENLVIIGSHTKFFAPVKLGDTIIFEAKGRYEEARKREVTVIGIINEVKVFEGVFQAVLLKQHILEAKIEDLQANLSANKELAS